MTPLAVAPALPLHSAGPYVAAAYIVFLLVMLIYLVIMAVRQRTTERGLNELQQKLSRREQVSAAAGADASTPATVPAGTSSSAPRGADASVPASTGSGAPASTSSSTAAGANGSAESPKQLSTGAAGE